MKFIRCAVSDSTKLFIGSQPLCTIRIDHLFCIGNYKFTDVVTLSDDFSDGVKTTVFEVSDLDKPGRFEVSCNMQVCI